MKLNHSIKASIVVTALLAWPLAQAATMSRPDYQAGKTRISADYKTDKSACASFTANAKDICVEQAKGKEKVARAELEFGYTGKPADQTKVAVAKAKSNYAVAREMCDDKSGNDKDVCIKESKAVESKAMADSKMSKEIGEARTDAADTKRDADYKVAAEKCDAMAADAKSACMVSAKARYGKT